MVAPITTGQQRADFRTTITVTVSGSNEETAEYVAGLYSLALQRARTAGVRFEGMQSQKESR